MDWSAFWSGVLGNAVPGACVAALMLLLTFRVNRSLERHKKELEQNLVKFTKLHDKRLEATVAVYHAFCDYLDFLRKTLYVRERRLDLTPMHSFKAVVARQSIYLDSETYAKVLEYQIELLDFWNWAVRGGEAVQEEVRRRLDDEIPAYAHKLRNDVGRVIDPHHIAA